jgi:hypothetical protein
MAGIGDLVTHLVANTAGFQQGFAKGQSIAKTGVAGITSAIAPDRLSGPRKKTCGRCKNLKPC